MRSFAAISFLLSLMLSSCGTMDSLEKQSTFVDFAIIQVNSELKVEGQILSETDSTLVIAVNGSTITYRKQDIISISKYKAPSPYLMQKDQTKNSKRAADNTGFFVGLFIITAALTLILSPPPSIL